MKKVLLLMMAFTFFIGFVAPDDADARRSSGKRSFTKAPSKPADNNVSRSDSSTAPKSQATNTGANANRGFFSGGGLMKGLMIGGLAGMLFGGMFGGLGAMGDFLGLIINVLAIYVLFIAVRGIFRYFKRQKEAENARRQN
ncbi:hypothetical protein EBB07_12900 [Paenibacillaceae bacterium]|nr:hypothetical protein EBB07_12900 [Paenibacillaceae bacterium]